MVKRSVLLLATCLITLPSFAQQPTTAPDPAESKQAAHLDGGWWKGKSYAYRDAWISGYKTGLHRGEGHDTELTKFGTKELHEGMSKFYGDFRNRNVSVHDALLFVADQLSGVPDDKLNAELLKLRASAVNAAPAE